MRTMSRNAQKSGGAIVSAYDVAEFFPFFHQQNPSGMERQADPDPESRANMEICLSGSSIPNPFKKARVSPEKNEAEEAIPAFLGNEFSE